MNFSKKQFTVLLFVIAFFQLSKAQNLVQYVPSDAMVVMSVNLDQLNKKVSLDKLKQFDFYQGMLKELRTDGETEAEKAYVKKFLESPSDIGFNMLQPFHFFMQMEGDFTYYAVVMKMGDQSKYEAGLKEFKLDQFAPNLVDNGNYKFWSHADEAFAWNDEVILNIWADKTFNYDDWSSVGEEEYNWEEPQNDEEEIVFEDSDIMEMEPIEEEMETPEEQVEELVFEDVPLESGDPYFENSYIDEEKKQAVEAFAKKIMNKEFPNNLSANSKYRIAVADAVSDVHMWMDYSYFLEAMKGGSNSFGMMGSEAAMMMQSMTSVMDVFYSGAFMSMGLNFQNGKMAISSDMFFNEDMMRFYKGALDGKFNKKFLRYVEGGDQLFGYYYFNLNVKKSIDEGKALMHKAMLATPQYGQMADDAMKILGIFIDEDAIANLMKGDLLLSVSGMKMMEFTQTTYDFDDDFNVIPKDTTVVKKMPVITMLASYGSQEDIMKFIDLGVHSEVIKREKNYFKMTVPNMGADVYLALKDGVMIFTNDQNLVTSKLESGYKGKQRLTKKHRKLMCKNSSVFFWDVPNTLYAVGGENPTAGDPATAYLEMLAKQFDNLELSSSKKVDESIKSKMDFNFTNEGTNSLEQFFNFVNDIYIELVGGAKI